MRQPILKTGHGDEQCAVNQEVLSDRENGFKIPKLASFDEIVDRVLGIHITANNESSEVQINQSGMQLSNSHGEVYYSARVLLCTYRVYASPQELLLKFTDRSAMCHPTHYRNILDIWTRDYPEDFEYMIKSDISDPEQSSQADRASRCSAGEYSTTANSITRPPSEASVTTPDFEFRSGGRLLDISLDTYWQESDTHLVSKSYLSCEDVLIEEKEEQLNIFSSLSSPPTDPRSNRLRQRSIRSGRHPVGRSMLLAMDSRFVAEQLTAMDIKNMIRLRSYSLLIDTKSDPSMKDIVKNFNLLSRHVVLSILESHNPLAVTLHWISICLNLKRLKNFNSLKAVISGLTNESIYRLRKTIWSRLTKVAINSFKSLASDVDDSDNQMTLRRKQLEYLDSESVIIVPYLGTFLTDLNFLSARYPKYTIGVEPTSVKIIDFEMCSRQYEVIRTIDLFQKKIIDKFLSPVAIHQSQDFSLKNYLLIYKSVPKVSRVFEKWFMSHTVSSTSDREW